MQVRITKGPSWAVGKTGMYDGEFITFYDHMQSPHWYDANEFTWELI